MNSIKLIIAITAVIIPTKLFTQNFPDIPRNKSIKHSTGIPVGDLYNYPGEVIWESSFSDVNDWNIGNNDSVDINFEIGTGLLPSGNYAINPIISETDFDGFAMLDSDVNGNEVETENCWIETANSLDLSQETAVLVEFTNQYYKWNSEDNEHCLLEISLDGGETWPDINSVSLSAVASGSRHDLWPNMKPQEFTYNGTKILINISEYAAGMGEVKLRWRWTGTNGYAWMIDDVKILRAQPNDLSLKGKPFSSKGIYSNLNGVTSKPIIETDSIYLSRISYSAYPESQRPDLIVQTPVINFSDADYDSLIIQMETEESLFSPTFNLDGFEINPSIKIDTLQIENLPLNFYQYPIELQNNSQDPSLSNDITSHDLLMTDFEYRRDNNLVTGEFPSSEETSQPFVIGSKFEIFEKATIYNIQFVVTDNSSPDAEALVQLYEIVGDSLELAEQSYEIPLFNSDNFSSLGSTEPNWICFALDNPVNVSAGQEFMAAVTFFGGANSVHIGLGQSGISDQSAMVYIENEGGYGYYNLTDLPLIRLNFNYNECSSINVNELSVESSQILAYPNPAQSHVSFDFNAIFSSDVSLKCFDQTGSLKISEMITHQNIEENVYQLDISGLSPGAYCIVFYSENELRKTWFIKE